MQEDFPHQLHADETPALLPSFHPIALHLNHELPNTQRNFLAQSCAPRAPSMPGKHPTIELQLQITSFTDTGHISPLYRIQVPIEYAEYSQQSTDPRTGGLLGSQVCHLLLCMSKLLLSFSTVLAGSSFLNGLSVLPRAIEAGGR